LAGNTARSKLSRCSPQTCFPPTAFFAIPFAAYTTTDDTGAFYPVCLDCFNDGPQQGLGATRDKTSYFVLRR
jgi:hypothetical protein